MKWIRLIVTAWCVAIPLLGAGADEIGYVNSIMWTGCRDIVADNGRVYAAFRNGLQIFDVANPSEPRVIDQRLLPGNASGVNLDSRGYGYIYVADGEAGLYITSEHFTPYIFQTRGACRDIFTSGNYAYAATDSGLQIIDITHGWGAQPLGMYESPQYSEYQRIVVDNGFAYMIDVMGMDIIDVSDPSTPTLAATYEYPGYDFMGIVVRGDYAYIAAPIDFGVGELLVIDITDPHAPSLAGEVILSGDPYDVALSDNCAYLPCGNYTCHVVDISNPSVPVDMGSENRPNDYAIGVAIWADNMYIADNAQRPLRIYDISQPLSPQFAGVFDCHNISANNVAMDSNYAYVAADWAGLQVVDISDPANLSFRGSYGQNDLEVVDVDIRGRFAYLACCWPASIKILDIYDPDNPFLAGNIEVDDYPKRMFTVEHFAYIVTGYNSYMQIIDIADPYNPFTHGIFGMYIKDVCASGDYAYLSSYLSDQRGMLVVNVSDPDAPYLVGHLELTNAPTAVRTSGNYAYLCTADGLIVVDITDPTTPQTVGASPVPAYRITIAGNYAYVAGGRSGVSVLDISNPSNPVVVASYDTPGSSIGVDFFGNFISVADQYSYILLRYPSSGCSYVPGDVNNNFNHDANGIDVVYSVEYFKGGPTPPNVCSCGDQNVFYPALDVNGDCRANGVDVQFYVNYLKGRYSSLLYCIDCPPEGR